MNSKKKEGKRELPRNSFPGGEKNISLWMEGKHAYKGKRQVFNTWSRI